MAEQEKAPGPAFTNQILAPTPTARSREMFRTSSFDEAIGWT
jgi:hypothetical protein